MSQLKKKDEKMQTEQDLQTPEAEEHAAEVVEEAEVQTLEEKLQEEKKTLQDTLLRHHAEFDNYKKRTAKEKDEMFAYAKGTCLTELLTVVDNFERALAVETSDEEYRKGIVMIFNQFMEILKKQGIEEIAAQGKEFDPNFHNAVNQVQDEKFGENEVCQVFQKGYKLGDKVLRHAMVVVANP